ncbi:sigma-70 family RNA polymerase sigma factor [Bacteroidaceae bacterium HV4-6-C5C]|nr:sigma-70 family RNA polymerase sigma factor [Bacteroidaceae bacterium HV4-6-C5C]
MENQINDQSKQQWKLFIEGNNDAYAWLYSHYVQHLYQFGCRFTDDSELVKDCIQDVFIQIYQNHKNLSLPENVKVYFMAALKNCLFNSFARKQRFDAYMSTISGEEEYSFDLSVEESFIADETLTLQGVAVSRMLDSLSARQREIIYYRFYEELGYEEICKLMDLNYQSACNLIQRALTKLRVV